MAVDFQVWGPITVKYASTSVGQTDGQLQIEQEVYHPAEAITTDARGGEPADYVQKGSRAVVTMTLIGWDRAAIEDLAGALMGGNTPAFTDAGDAQTVGSLRFADRPAGTNTLVLAGTKATAANGGYTRTYPKATLDPEATVRLQRMGSTASRVSFALVCLPDDSGNLWTDASVT